MNETYLVLLELLQEIKNLENDSIEEVKKLIYNKLERIENENS